jgi:hypothetical protein
MVIRDGTYSAAFRVLSLLSRFPFKVYYMIEIISHVFYPYTLLDHFPMPAFIRFPRTLGGRRYSFHPSVMGIIFGDTHAFLLLSTQQFDMNRGAEGFGDPSEYA